MNNKLLWERYKKYLCPCPSIGLRLDISRMNFGDDLLAGMEPAMQKAYADMEQLEAGAIANPDENRMVGHYWLRAPERSPSPDIRREIEENLQAVRNFSYAVNTERIVPKKHSRFNQVLVIGIGGSALGPQFVADALGTPKDPLRPFFIDNTDPDGIDRVLSSIKNSLEQTLVVVISKSGGTIETRNGMLETIVAYRKEGIVFEKHAVAVTGVGSKLYNTAKSGDWLAVFPMWDWIGGRTSEFSAVGLLPGMLQGIDMEEMLKGAALCDDITRSRTTLSNPAALLALSWYHATGGQGKKDMVILPYKDRLQLFPRYLQQLVMESIGKEKDRDGKVVNQGLTVFGNKGSTDQHAYVQQLRDGVNNFFATFIEVLKDRDHPSVEVAPGETSGDHLSAFLQGTRDALHENGRESITVTIERIDARSLGALIALYERAVGLYASLVNVNAYHQPGVEAGKKMSGASIRLQAEVFGFLRKNSGRSFTAEEVAEAIRAGDRAEPVFRILEHAGANADHKIRRTPGKSVFETRYEAV